MKKILTISLMLFSVVAFSKEIRITIEGGKPCKSNPTEVCFNRVYTHDNDKSFVKSCTGRGINPCPKSGIVSVGHANLDSDAIVALVETSILTGNNSGKGVVQGTEGVIATYTWTGKVNADGLLDYEINISTIEE